MKKNMSVAKWMGLGAVGFFVLLWFSGHGHSNQSSDKKDDQTNQSGSAVVHATNEEELRYNTAEMSQLVTQNKKIVAENDYLKNKIDQTHDGNLKKIQDSVDHLMHSQQERIEQLSDKINSLKDSTHSSSHTSIYPVNGKVMSTTSSHGRVITIVNDMSLPTDTDQSGTANHDYQPLLKTAQANQNSMSDNSDATNHPKPKDIPYFTIPANSTLGDVVLQTDILAEVPVSGALLQPAYKFKAILGRKDLMASNGIMLPPDLNGIVFEGYSIGNMAMSCARGYVTKMLFTWKDGNYTVVGKEAKGTELNPQDSLGYISTPYGNPCLPGKYITDAPRVLSSMALMGGIAGGANAFAQAQTSSILGQAGAFTSLTGNTYKYMGGLAVGNAANKALDWYTKRVSDVFDAVFIPASHQQKMTHVVVNVTQTIPIDKKLNGRKLNYARDQQGYDASMRLD